MTIKWDEVAENWDTESEVILYSKKAFSSLYDRVELNDLRIMDFGCGTGLLTEKISPFVKSILALDSSKKMTKILKVKNIKNVTVVNDVLTSELIQNINELQLQYDLIVASSVCAFLPNYFETLELLYSLLIPGGMFVQWDWLITEKDDEFGMDVRTVSSGFESVGLEIIFLGEIFSHEGKRGPKPVLMGIGKKSLADK